MLMFKLSIQTDLHNKICLQIKFLYFFEFFYYLLSILQKIVKFRHINYVSILINSKKIQKNVKFHLEAHFIVEIMLNGLDRRIGL